MSDRNYVLSAPETPDAIEFYPDFGHIPLRSIVNTRDLGGMPAADGRRIKPRVLIRASALAHAHEKDLKVLLGDYQLRRVVDLRSEFERNQAPDEEKKLPGVTYAALPLFEGNAVGIANGAGIGDELRTIREISGNPFALVAGLYKKAFLEEPGISSFSTILAMILEAEEGSTLWHCSEGKDRTGLVAYLVEYALGVSEENRMADYLATNLFVRNAGSKLLDGLGMHHILQGIDADMEAMFFAHREYLHGAIDAVQEAYGSFARYMAEALDFGEDKAAALREKYLVG